MNRNIATVNVNSQRRTISPLYTVLLGTMLLGLAMMTSAGCRQGLSSYDPSRYFEQAQQSHAHIRSVVIEGKIVREENGNIINGKIRMMTDLDGHLRVDIVSPFDQPMGILIASDKSFQYFDYAKATLYEGQPEPCTLAQFLSISLMPHDVLPLLTGLPPLVGQAYHVDSQRPSHTGGSSGPQGETTMIANGSQGERQTLVLQWFGNEWVASSSEIDAPITATPSSKPSETTVPELFPVLRVSYKDYAYIGQTPVPQSISVSEPVNKRSLTLMIKHEDLNVTIPPASFVFTPPSNTTREHISCNASPPPTLSIPTKTQAETPETVAPSPPRQETPTE